MTTTRITAPSFTRNSNGSYNVRWGREVLGTVIRSTNRWGTFWIGTHRDGTPAPTCHTRIDAAWAMVNS